MAQENINRIQTQLAQVKSDLEEAISDPNVDPKNYETIMNHYVALKKELKEAQKNRGDLGGRRRKTIRRKSKRKSKRKSNKKSKKSRK
jgi:U3 small nucleolar ribonucleoprotein component